MKKIQNIVLLLTLVGMIVGCASPARQLNRGNYYQATVDAVRKLRTNPNKIANQDVLLQSYPMALKMAERDIYNASQSNNLDKYDVMVARYEEMNHLAEEIYRCPIAHELIRNPQEFHSELAEVKGLAAEQAYNLGLQAMTYKTLDQSRIAYNNFVKAGYYVPNYRDVVNKIEESRYAATLRVIVEPPQTPANFQVSAEFFYSNLVTEMAKVNRNQFVRLYTPEEAKNERMTNPHQYLVLDFLEFYVGNVSDSKNTTEVKRDSVIVGTVDVGGKKVNAYNTVKAQFTRYQREVSSGGKMHVRIIDATNSRVIEQRAFEGSYVWKNIWATYSGDDRALTNEQIKQTKSQAELPPPHQDLFIEFTKPIYTQVVSYVRSAYSKYYVNTDKK